MGKFVASPEVLRANGNKLVETSRQFKQNVDKIYATKNQLIQTNFVSPEARAIGNEIETYRNDLDKMTRVIEEYGMFLQNAANKVVRNQQQIIDEIH